MKLNKSEIVQKVIEWANSSIGRSINTKKLNQELEKENNDPFFLELCSFIGIEPIYHQ